MDHYHLPAWTTCTDSTKPPLCKLTPSHPANMIAQPYWSPPSAEARTSLDVPWVLSVQDEVHCIREQQSDYICPTRCAVWDDIWRKVREKLGAETFSSSRMRFMNHNWSACKQHLHVQSVAQTSRHSVLSEDRIRQCVALSGSHCKDTDQCL